MPRPEKRAAIAKAALAVFLREGYARASVDVIAAEAGVSKRTVYNHYGDKENLFLSVIAETDEGMAEAFTAMLDRTLGEVTDVEAALLAFGREFATAVARSPERSAVMRLLIAEITHFPALREQWGGVGRTQRALADRLADLASRGLLAIDDPVEAAAHFGVLATSMVNNLSLYGAVPVSDERVDELVTGGVRLFLRAHRP
ncbi:TetR/AcrR family transcriptional regulator [Umezawaea tangerina]|uniref:TetR family transcriptional regulator n=1 Tax=Umezawaea tangerina TaxID=84725 RepID=A0A2T0SJZ8_9PSEU|nr:TetR/AcrR family transcriptional regulator [Umezawaea tangerina]PRY33737.1 TetR family transcriptional regulator [Umezawaea tangerina]